MQYLIGIIIFITSLFWLLNRASLKWLKYGKLSRRSNFVVNQHNYYMEEVKLESYREAINIYQKSIDEIYRYGKIIDMQYDLYDWTVSYIQFKDITIAIQLSRPLHTIQLVQSEKSMQIQAMEADNPFL
ncbi:hypothetical protein [Psychromonas aquimarina]|uniref:hypothetical protein n=1 Tax=Psychromonas aquimarina TaxID=444919 RepID=UPI00040CDB16|nr:hypothetical protein [Psychromonas aquimarina]